MFKRLVALALLCLSLPATAYTVSAGRILDDGGQPVQLRGINWFGFEGQDGTVHGLWARNWKDMIQQMKGQGFNAVRLPFCPGSLTSKTPLYIDYYLNADLQGLSSLQVFDKVVYEFDAQGFKILLDFHHHDCSWISDLWYTDTYSESQWITDLKFVANRYKDVKGVIGLDLKNEPHGTATWGSGNTATDWNLAAERAAAQVMPVAPNWLMFVEGISDSSYCTEENGHFWAENLQPLNCKGLNISASKLVVSAHVYGPDVYPQSYFDDPSFPANMPAIWQKHFGHAVDKGYKVVLGEFGGPYGESNAYGTADPRDVAWQNALVDYLISKGMSDSFYWSWNPNSPDTGGVLRDDWKSVRTDKVALLQKLWSAADGETPPADEPPAEEPPPPPVSGITTNSTSITAKISSSTDDGTAYCNTIRVSNISTTTTIQWQVKFNLVGTLTKVANAVLTQSGTKVTAVGKKANVKLKPGASTTFNFCGTR